MTTTIILVRKMMLFVLIDNRKVDIITIVRAIFVSDDIHFCDLWFLPNWEDTYLHLALDLDSLHITEQIFKYSKILHFPRPLEAAVPFNYPRYRKGVVWKGIGTFLQFLWRFCIQKVKCVKQKKNVQKARMVLALPKSSPIWPIFHDSSSLAGSASVSFYWPRMRRSPLCDPRVIIHSLSNCAVLRIRRL